MELTPEHFWTLTPREFWIKHAGFIRKQNRALKLAAQYALMVAPRGPNMTPEKLLGVRGMFNIYPIRED